MTRKDYCLIADVLADYTQAYNDGEDIEPRNVAHMFAAALADTNPRFDRARFLAACGVEA